MRHEIVAPTDCTIVEIRPEPGDSVPAGVTIAIVEMMKIERLVEAPAEGVITEVRVSAGEVVKAGQVLAILEEQSIAATLTADDPNDGATGERADLAEYHARRALLDDEARPEAITKVHARGRRTARENLADLVDPGSFQEYGSFMYAAQKGRRDVDDLIRNTPGDGIVGGLGTVNAAHFGEEASLVGVMSYDYTVLAGTQGFRGHEKKDRLLPVVDQSVSYTHLTLPTT